jgi:hypothetical protein
LFIVISSHDTFDLSHVSLIQIMSYRCWRHKTDSISYNFVRFDFKSLSKAYKLLALMWQILRQISWNFWIKYFHLICHLILTKINCITLKIRSKADFKSKSQNIWQQIILFSRMYSNAKDMRVTQNLNSFGEIIAHAQCSVDEKK